MRSSLLVILISFMLPLMCSGQISQGGEPQDLIMLKSASIPLIEMPYVNNYYLREKTVDLYQKENGDIKPFKFAHAFDVNLNPENSGQWFKTVYGLNSWVLKIRSEKAKSLNLIFSEFELPNEARLFIYNGSKEHLLGAFTSANNKLSGKFAVSPVEGDEIVIHYEVPDHQRDLVPFTIKKVNHDFVGILEKSVRRPLGEMAGECNIDINCDLGEKWNDVKDAVCRMIVNGVEICTGALINNTNEDEKPYIISASHCYDKWEYAETSIYTFNYESPFCAPLDGDPVNTISGAFMKAQFDSLDFALVELSVIPPPDFRPFYAGWSKSEELPDSTVSIHHPQGDIKKIAVDNDPPVISDFNSQYTKNGFLKIQRWEAGVTEVGSSGGPLFDMEQNIIGTLTGGVAVCSNPVRDYFERFSLSWDYKNDSTKQLKYWLDPKGTDSDSFSGKRFYEDEDYCGAFTNLNDNDTHELVSLTASGKFEGYWGGTNNVGITEFVEQFSIYGNEQLSGVSLGVGKIHKSNQSTSSTIKIKVYNGAELPEEMIYSKNVLIRDMVDDAMNFIRFDEIVEPSDTFFVGFELSNMQRRDSFVVYQSLRPANTKNHFYFKENNAWRNFDEATSGYNSMVNVFELVACNLEDTINEIPGEEKIANIDIFPNPAFNELVLRSGAEVYLEDISVVNLMGQRVEAGITRRGSKSVKISLAGNVPGVYFIRINTSKGFISKKVSYIPW